MTRPTAPHRILAVDLDHHKARVEEVSFDACPLGGSALAAHLYREHLGRKGTGLDAPWNHPAQPIVLAVGPLTGLYPLMSKTVAGFKSPYHNQYAESHAGGRLALSLKFAGYDALVLTGQAHQLSWVAIGSHLAQVRDATFLSGADMFRTGKTLRRIAPGTGHRSIVRISAAGENLVPTACANVDSYRHFGRLGMGAALGAKKIKAIFVQGDGSFAAPNRTDYPKAFAALHRKVTATDLLRKYHDLGTTGNVLPLNELKALPFRNAQQTWDACADRISGERFADERLLRNVACAGCPIGCVHIGFLREAFQSDEHHYSYIQIAYDYELAFSLGSMLGVLDTRDVLRLIDRVEAAGLDAMSAGVALAWATEATQEGYLDEGTTLVPLRFGDTPTYLQAIEHLADPPNEFYRALGAGTHIAAARFGGADFACVLGQEMAGYATGPAAYAAQALGFRHSHLDSAGYTYDQKYAHPTPDATVAFLLQDEQERIGLTSLVSCLFARGVYDREQLRTCLTCAGLAALDERYDQACVQAQKARWRLRLEGGFDPKHTQIPRRLQEVVTARGPLDAPHLQALLLRYAEAIESLARQDHPSS